MIAIDPHVLLDCMTRKTDVTVKTETREFSGKVFHMGLSPYTNDTRAGVVDSEGRVHYFTLDRARYEIHYSGA